MKQCKEGVGVAVAACIKHGDFDTAGTVLAMSIAAECAYACDQAQAVAVGKQKFSKRPRKSKFEKKMLKRARERQKRKAVGPGQPVTDSKSAAAWKTKFLKQFSALLSQAQKLSKVYEQAKELAAQYKSKFKEEGAKLSQFLKELFTTLKTKLKSVSPDVRNNLIKTFMKSADVSKLTSKIASVRDSIMKKFRAAPPKALPA